MIIVTTGRTYTDIDGLACVIGYTELLRLKDEEAIAFLPGVFNQSITESMRKWNFQFVKDFDPEWLKNNTKFVIVDISDPEWRSQSIPLENIIEVFDHHYGFEDYWSQKLGKNSHIEKVGSCTTLIWQEYKKAGLVNKVSKLVANLFITCTIAQTLNFQAKVTVTADSEAVKELRPYSNLPQNWIQNYFQELESALLKNPLEAMQNDTKTTEINQEKYVMVQLELWDSRQFLDLHEQEILNYLQSFADKYKYVFFTSPSISEGKNYLVSSSEATKNRLAEVIGATFEGDIGTTSKLYLRKEIIKELIN